MNYEMRMLKHELRDIKQTSGYFILNHESSGGLAERGKVVPKNRRRKKTRVAKKKHRVTNAEYMSEVDGKLVRSSKNSSKTETLSALPNVSIRPGEKLVSRSQEHASKLSNPLKITDRSYVNITLDTATSKYNNPRTLSNSHDVSPSAPLDILATTTNEEGFETKNVKSIRPNSREFTKSDTMLGLNMDTARGRVQNRLTGNVENSNLIDDLSPYMHVPPDGLPRTACLLPPLKDLLNEAKKARYIRKLRKPHIALDEDDPERELNIDEIFRKT
jgi:hypothetical protein